MVEERLELRQEAEVWFDFIKWIVECDTPLMKDALQFMPTEPISQPLKDYILYLIKQYHEHTNS